MKTTEDEDIAIGVACSAIHEYIVHARQEKNHEAADSLCLIQARVSGICKNLSSVQDNVRAQSWVPPLTRMDKEKHRASRLQQIADTFAPKLSGDWDAVAHVSMPLQGFDDSLDSLENLLSSIYSRVQAKSLATCQSDTTAADDRERIAWEKAEAMKEEEMEMYIKFAMEQYPDAKNATEAYMMMKLDAYTTERNGEQVMELSKQMEKLGMQPLVRSKEPNSSFMFDEPTIWGNGDWHLYDAPKSDDTAAQDGAEQPVVSQTHGHPTHEDAWTAEQPVVGSIGHRNEEANGHEQQQFGAVEDDDSSEDHGGVQLPSGTIE